MLDKRSFLKAIGLLTMRAFLNPKDLLGARQQRSPRLKSTTKRIPNVVRVHNSKVTAWDYNTHPYIDYIDYDELKKMLAAVLMAYTGTKRITEAWNSILPDYREGKKIAIKPNLNNTSIGYSKAIMTSPQIIAAVVESLIEAGCSPQDIVLYDLTAKMSNELSPWLNRHEVTHVFRRKYSSFLGKISARLNLGPQDQDTHASIKMRSRIIDDPGYNVTCYIPNVLSNADYLINLPVFKAHQFVLQSNALKNHFGTVRFSNYNAWPTVLHGDNIEKHIVDINRNEHIQHKTAIVIVDGLYGAPLFTRDEYGRVPTPWKTLSTGPTPNSLFISSDPVAVESILADYIIHEQERAGYEPYSHQYLHDAMELGLGNHAHRDRNGKYGSINFTEIQL